MICKLDLLRQLTYFPFLRYVDRRYHSSSRRDSYHAGVHHVVNDDLPRSAIHRSGGIASTVSKVTHCVIARIETSRSVGSANAEQHNVRTFLVDGVKANCGPSILRIWKSTGITSWWTLVSVHSETPSCIGERSPENSSWNSSWKSPLRSDEISERSVLLT